MFCPTNLFWNQLSLQLISKEIRRAEREYMNMHPPPPINALVTVLCTISGDLFTISLLNNKSEFKKNLIHIIKANSAVMKK